MSGSNSWCHSASGRISTLSGGACGCAPIGAPTAWNSESACGTSTIPSTVTVTGASPARPIETVSPGWAARLAAVCWNSSTPSLAPIEVTELGGERRPVPLADAEHLPGSGGLRGAGLGGLEAGGRGERDGLRGDDVLASLRRHWRASAASAPGCASTCQSTATVSIARRVMVAFDADRNVPSEASSPTARAIPMAVAARRPVRRRSAARPAQQTSEHDAQQSFGLRSGGRWSSTKRWSSRSATAASWVLTIRAAPVVGRCSDEGVDDHGSAGVVELSGWFVGQDQPGLAGQYPSDSDALCLTAGEFFGQFRREGFQVESAQGSDGLLAGGVAVDALQQQRKRHVLDDVEGRQKTRCLEHDRDRSGTQLARLLRSPAIRSCPPSGDRDLPARCNKRRLARSGRAGQRDQIAGAHVAGDAVNGDDCARPGAERAGYIGRDNERIGEPSGSGLMARSAHREG